MTKSFPKLRKGERVWYDSKVFTVIRVTRGAAYLAVGDWLDGHGQVLPREWGKVIAISPHSKIDRVVD